MRTIAILNLKGGVAKTASTVNIAAILRHYHHRRVLVVDTDSQGNTTEFFGGDPARGNLASAMLSEADDGTAAAWQIQSAAHGVDLLAASDQLMDLDLSSIKATNDGTPRANVEALRSMVGLLAERDMYDYCLIDCPPAFNAACAAALLAADEVVIPIKLDAFSLRGMTNLLRQIRNMQAINPSLRLAGLLPTMWYTSPRTMQAENILAESGLPILPHIRRSDKVDEMTFTQQPLCLFSPTSAAGVDYRRFVAGWLEGGAING